MPTSRSDLRARLQAEAEAIIEELLAQKKAPDIASLADIEHVALQASQRLAEVITTELLEDSGQALTAQWPTCPTCGKRLLAKGKRARRVVTEGGEAVIVRDYYYCRHCRQGIFPPG